MSKISGGFLCGSLRYTSSAEPVMVAICHCTDCQKQSNSAFSVNVGVPEASIEPTGDTARDYAVTGTSGQAVTRYFCTTCGGPTQTVPEAFQGLVVIKAGTLDELLGEARRADLVRLRAALGRDLRRNPEDARQPGIGLPPSYRFSPPPGGRPFY